MSEVLIPLPIEIEDLLQEGCRECLFARNWLQQARVLRLDLAAEAERLNKECSTWQGEESQQEALVNEAQDPALAMSFSFDNHCPHPLSKSIVEEVDDKV